MEIIQKWELFMVLFMVLMVQKNLDALNGGIQFSNQKSLRPEMPLGLEKSAILVRSNDVSNLWNLCGLILSKINLLYLVKIKILAGI